MIIGLTGKARSGKDTVARILFMDHGFMRVAIADPLKDTAACLFGLSPDEFHDDSLKDEVDSRWGITRRKMMQDLGEMVKEKLGNDFWMRHWFNSYSKVGDRHDVVVTDVRFDHEAEKIMSLGGVIIEVIREGSGLAGETSAHVSEAGIRKDMISHRIFNDGSIGELAVKVSNLVHTLGDK